MGIILQAIVEVKFEDQRVWDDVCEFDLCKDYEIMGDLEEIEGVEMGWPVADETMSVRARDAYAGGRHDLQTATPQALLSLLSPETTAHLREPDDPPWSRSPRFRALCAAVASLAGDPLLGDDRVRVLLFRR